MNKIPKYIEIVRSTNCEVISLRKDSAEAIRSILQDHYEVVNISVVNNLSDLELLVSKQPDLVFLGSKFLSAKPTGKQPLENKIWFSKYLDKHGITHTGSAQTAIEYECNKALGKQRVQDAGLKTAPFLVIKKGVSMPTNLVLHFPLFVKPDSLGGGQGIDESSVVHTPAKLRAKAKFIAEQYSEDALVEEYLPGREFSVAILKAENSNNLITMPIELIAQNNNHGNRLLDQKTKNANSEQVLVVKDSKVRTDVINLAKRVFVALGARDYGRIDIRLDGDGVPHFLEANLIPGLGSSRGYFSRACRLNTGMEHEDLILHIVRLGFAHTTSAIANKQELLDINLRGSLKLTLLPRGSVLPIVSLKDSSEAQISAKIA